MKLAKKLRRYWHDVYFAIAPASGVEFAMKCRDVAHVIDLGENPSDLTQKLRFHLHLSVCQACTNYFRFSAFLKKKLRPKKSDDQSMNKQAAELNRKLLTEFRTKKTK